MQPISRTRSAGRSARRLTDCIAQRGQVRTQGVRRPRDVQVILEHESWWHDLGQLHVRAAVTETHAQGILGFRQGELLLEQELVGEGGVSEVEELRYVTNAAEEASGSCRSVIVHGRLSHLYSVRRIWEP